MRWYQQSPGEQDTHRAVSVSRGRVTTVCGMQFTPLGRRGLDDVATMPPGQVCPRCRPGAAAESLGEASSAKAPATGPRCPSCGLGAQDLQALNELLRMRWVMRQVIALARELPRIRDTQLRGRLAELAERAKAPGGPS